MATLEIIKLVQCPESGDLIEITMCRKCRFLGEITEDSVFCLADSADVQAEHTQEDEK